MADGDADSHAFESSSVGLETPMTYAGGYSGSSNCSPYTNDNDEIVNLQSASSNNVNSASWKRAQRLIRNREAAKRYGDIRKVIFLISNTHLLLYQLVPRNRMKKKDWIIKLQETNRAAKEENVNLKKKLAELEKEYHMVQSSLIDMQPIEHNAVSMRNIAPSADFSIQQQ